MSVYSEVSQKEMVKKSKELILSSRLLLNKSKLKDILTNVSLELNHLVKSKVIIFLPVKDQQLASEFISISKTLSKLENTICTNWNEFSVALLRNPTLILFHVDLIEHQNVSVSEFIGMMETLIKCMPGCVNAKLAVIITKSTDISLVKSIKKSSVIGLCPSPYNFGVVELDLAITELTQSKSYWPEYIMKQLADSVNKPSKSTEFKLTPKQQEVLDLICSRGASNKVIARIMGISESTVKIHVSAILKEYGLRNRTQLALAAKDSLKL